MIDPSRARWIDLPNLTGASALWRASLGAALTTVLVAVPGCKRDSTLDDVAPAPGDPYTARTTPPEQLPPSPAEGAGEDPPNNLGAPPPRADAPAPQDTAKPRSDTPSTANRNEPTPTPTPSAANGPAPQPAVAKPEDKKPNTQANQKLVSEFGLCRAQCASRSDLSAENMPTCKLACINDTAPKDTYAMGCKRDCMRDGARCYEPCESAGSASCRTGCERTLLSCMNECDVNEPR